MNSRLDRITRTLAASLLGAMLSLPAAGQVQAPQAPQAAPTKEGVERRLQSVNTLIEKSSAAQQVDKASGQEASSQRDRARDLHRQAAQAYDAGDYAKANTLLDQAAREMIGGTRKADPEQVTQDKKRRDFDNRLASVKALRDALGRIQQEKKSPKSAQLAAQVDVMTGEAVKLADAGQLDRARGKLDQAYLAAKAGIGDLREGDTLVRTLKFESKEEEYRYELDRNDTHQMLVKVLMGERTGEANVKTGLEQAAALRRKAEQQAGSKDYDGAIKTLEDSTRELVKVIRAAGIYIPG